MKIQFVSIRRYNELRKKFLIYFKLSKNCLSDCQCMMEVMAAIYLDCSFTPVLHDIDRNSETCDQKL